MNLKLVIFIIVDVIIILLLFIQLRYTVSTPQGFSRLQQMRSSFLQRLNLAMSDIKADQESKKKLLRFKLKEAKTLNDRIAKYIAKAPSSKDNLGQKAVPVMKNSTVLVYNRINKSGSTSMTRLFLSLSKMNRFLLLTGIGPTVSRDDALTWIQQRYMVPHAVWKMARLFCDQIHDRGVFMRLMYYEDYSRYGCRVRYFTQVRDPVDRFISRFNFNRDLVDENQWMRSAKFYVNQQKERHGSNMTRCITNKLPECVYQGTVPQYQRLYRADSQITWFCGTSEACRTLGHPDSVQLAIANIERDFLVVGVLEEMEKTIVVMECLMPEFLTGLGQLWADNQVHANTAHAEHDAVGEEARKILKDELENEYILYHYIRRRLEDQYTQCTTKKS